MDPESEDDTFVLEESEEDEYNGEFKEPSEYPDSDDALVLEFDEMIEYEPIAPSYFEDGYDKSIYSIEEDYIRKEINRVTEVLRLYLPEYEVKNLQEFSLHIVNKRLKKIDYPSELEDFISGLVDNLSLCVLGF